MLRWRGGWRAFQAPLSALELAEAMVRVGDLGPARVHAAIVGRGYDSATARRAYAQVKAEELAERRAARREGRDPVFVPRFTYGDARYGVKNTRACRPGGHEQPLRG